MPLTSEEPAAHPAPHHHTRTHHRFWHATVVAMMEIGIFHPADTIRVRLQLDKTPRVPGATLAVRYQTAVKAVWGEAAGSNARGMAASLYQGILPAALYKAIQRTVQFGAQPPIKDYLEDHVGDEVKQRIGKKTGEAALEASAGGIASLGEVALMPIERVKLHWQSDHNATLSSSLRAVWREGQLWRGAMITMARNGLGSCLLFGTASFVKQAIFHTTNKHHPASLLQTAVASAIASTVSLVGTAPIDLVRTRRIMNHQSNNLGALSIFARTVREEGMSALFKGLPPRLASVVPKMMFTYTAVSMLARLS